MMIKGERWDELLAPQAPRNIADKTLLLYAQGMAYLAKGDTPAAERQHRDLVSWVKEKAGKGGNATEYDDWTYQMELAGLLKSRRGDVAGALAELRRAVEGVGRMLDDPCPYPRDVTESIGRVLLDHKRYRDAEDELRKGKWKHNGYVDALIVEAQLADGRIDDAEKTYAAMQAAWRNADPDLPSLVRTQALLEKAAPGKERWKPTPADSKALERFGPATWQPYPAAPFTVTAPDGKRISLGDYQGRNLVLVFYLGGKCAHCLEQLSVLGKEKNGLAALDTDILAVSSDSVATKRRFMQNNPDYPLRLASDQTLAAAKALGAYDEFEDLELHATLLIDKQGRVRWYTSGSTPFMKFEHLKRELLRMNGHQALM
jgi:peroxiredoxin